MRSAVLLGLLGASLPVVHGAVSKHGFRLREARGYTKASEVAANSDFRLSKQADYIEMATELEKSLAPDAVFRVVDDHYVGKNGIGHVNFKQTVHGVDVDNADFSVHVRRSCADIFYEVES